MDSLELRGEEDEGMMLDDVMMTDDNLVDTSDNNNTSTTTEFHINLDKCPPSLQNTLIVSPSHHTENKLVSFSISNQERKSLHK